MKHIKRFSENQKVNEEIAGVLVIGGLLLSMGAPALIKWAKASWTKKMMEIKYKPTGKEEMVTLGEKGDIKFEEVKDSSTGETFWGVTYSDKTVADSGYEDKQYLLFDAAGFKKVKEEMASGKFSPSGSVKSWSKTPANAKDGTESF